MKNGNFIKRISGVVLILFFTVKTAFSFEIDRFEHINNEQGLSQNSVESIFCDSKGFLWVGTMNGLNKYDGYNFKIYRDKLGRLGNLTNNRIVSIWEDEQHFVWFETYDGYYHYFNPKEESFSTLPKYSVSLEEKNSRITCFFQYSDKDVWLGSSNSGVYLLRYDEGTSSYKQEQFLSRGQFSISNNNIRFIISDKNGNIWIGAANGLNLLEKEDYSRGEFNYQHFFSDQKFTSAAILNEEVWFGTESNGLVVYNLKTKAFRRLDPSNSSIESNHIDLLRATNNGNILIAGAGMLYVVKPTDSRWIKVELSGAKVQKVFEDYEGYLWITSRRFGVQRVDQNAGFSRYFDLTPPSFKYLSDEERPYFFEDSRKTLWICVHGGGLAKYNRESQSFSFYYNDPNNSNSISSNTVMCMTEDQNGTLWVGTSVQGGINKIIFKSPAFSSVQPNLVYGDFMENIVRAVMQDVNGVIWVATKGGDIKLYNVSLNEITPGIRNPFKKPVDPIFNVYSLFQDSKGHIWIGSKGTGVAVSKQPLRLGDLNYSRLEFYVYSNQPGNQQSVCGNNIYSIAEDHRGQIWIGAFGSGICYTSIAGDYGNLVFHSINTENSNLSNNQVRKILIDSKSRIWVSTAFGVNLMQENPETDNYANLFQNIYRDMQDFNSLSYNDVVHLFEDSKHNIWLGTSGGGVDKLVEKNGAGFKFENINETQGLINNEVFGILEDNQGFVWFSTENGLSRFDPRNMSFDNYNKSNGLSSNEFSENTCLKLNDGRLVFGGVKGFEVVDPGLIVSHPVQSKVIFTNLQLFNKPVDINTPGSPLRCSISYSDSLTLKHFQSSFSLEFSAMNYLDESKTQYAYKLDGFDKSWNFVGKENKASYTNLKHGKYTFRVKAALWNTRWDGRESSLFIEILPPWWQTTWAYIAYLVLFLSASFIITRVVIRIYSVRNELKIEKAVNEVKLQFFTNISHEIRTPLTLILGPIEDILSDKTLPDKYKGPLLLVQKNGKRMLHLLNQLLDFRKVQNRKMELKIAPIHINEFVSGIYQNFNAYAQHCGVEFIFSPEVKDDIIYCDPNKMDSVIFNLLSNAFKFTPKGGQICLKVEKSGNNVFIKVKDGGPGINVKDIPLIFNRYSILSGGNGSPNGTGIGLHLSYEIVKLHDGEIKVECPSGQGCEFIVVLKTGKTHFDNNPFVTFSDKYEETSFVKTEMADLLPVDEASSDNDMARNKPVLLIVEDNRQIFSYISDNFKDQYNIMYACDGAQGLEMAEKVNPDVIISDVMMPGMDGIEMTKQLKANFATCHIPVIMLTAKTSVDDQIHGIDAGAEAYLLKPFNIGVLKSMVATFIGQRKLILKKYRDKQDIPIADLKFHSRDQEFIESLVRHIEKNYSDPQLTINSLSEFSCVSRTVFYNKVKSLTGLSPVEFLRQIKLKIAAKMLEQGYNVSEAALNIGFNDTRYFSRQFRDLFGESPSQYRKSHNDNNLEKEDSEE